MYDKVEGMSGQGVKSKYICINQRSQKWHWCQWHLNIRQGIRI